MSLADKIMQLRKQQGWSQIDLADRLDVSRQSVSKWEMGQAVPELDKIIKLSELFDVTTDYLLKDNAPTQPTESGPAPEPEEENAPAPEPAAEKTSKKKWPIWRWIAIGIAAVVFLFSVLFIIAAVSYNYIPNSAAGTAQVTAVDALPTPTPMPATSETTWTIHAESTDETYEGPVMETYTFGKGETAFEGEPVSPEEMTDIAKEYESFGVIYDTTLDQWYFQGEPVRIFTDIMTSNGQPLEGGNFHGVMRSFAGEGTIDIRTVRDYDRPNEDGNGTLIGIEKFDANPDAVLEEKP